MILLVLTFGWRVIDPQDSSGKDWLIFEVSRRDFIRTLSLPHNEAMSSHDGEITHVSDTALMVAASVSAGRPDRRAPLRTRLIASADSKIWVHPSSARAFNFRIVGQVGSNGAAGFTGITSA
jgi:hypothetical protein